MNGSGRFLTAYSFSVCAGQVDYWLNIYSVDGGVRSRMIDFAMQDQLELNKRMKTYKYFICYNMLPILGGEGHCVAWHV
jgi:hypothetical protein